MSVLATPHVWESAHQVDPSYAELENAQYDVMAARREVLGSLPANQVETFHMRLEAAQAHASAAQEELEKHRAESLLREQAKHMQKEEARRIRVQLRGVEQERDHLKEQMRRLQIDATSDASDVLKAMLAEKDLEIHRITQALSRAKADGVLITQRLHQSQA